MAALDFAFDLSAEMLVFEALSEGALVVAATLSLKETWILEVPDREEMVELLVLEVVI